MKQTAVEWLQDLYNSRPAYEEFILDEEFEQAKAMGKEQITYAYGDGQQNGREYEQKLSKGHDCNIVTAEQYYNEIYTDKPKLAYGVYNDISNRKPDKPLPGEGEGPLI